jgi:hypothetical protein
MEETKWSEDMVVVAEEQEERPSFFQENKGTIITGLITAVTGAAATFFTMKWVDRRKKLKFYRDISNLIDKIESANEGLKEVPNDDGEIEDVTSYSAPTTRELIYVIETKLKVETSEKEREILVSLLDRLIRLSQNVMKNEVAVARPRKQ